MSIKRLREEVSQIEILGWAALYKVEAAERKWAEKKAAHKARTRGGAS